MIGGKG